MTKDFFNQIALDIDNNHACLRFDVQIELYIRKTWSNRIGETGEKWDMGWTGTPLYLEKYSANQ